MVRVDLGVPFVTPRATIVWLYNFVDGDDYVFAVTSKGNKELVERYKDMLGTNNIKPDCELNLFRCKPWYDQDGKIIGSHVSQICQIDPHGSLPNFVKTWITRFLAEPILMVAEFCKSLRDKK
jgi:hypothetical protein